jgi:hypothetical protein
VSSKKSQYSKLHPIKYLKAVQMSRGETLLNLNKQEQEKKKKKKKKVFVEFKYMVCKSGVKNGIMVLL